MSEEKQEVVETQEAEGQLTAEDVQKMIQSETDKVRTDYSKKLKELEQEKKELEKQHMSDEEKKKAEFEEYQQQLSEKEQLLKEKELNLTATDLLKEEGLPLDFRGFLVGKDEDDTKKRVNDFKKLWVETLNNEVDKRFKASGRNVSMKETHDNKENIKKARKAMGLK